MKTVSDILKLSTDYLQKKGLGRARRQAEELLSHVLGLPRIELYMQFDRPLIEQELTQLREFIKRRGEGEPWQYILGKVEFLGCTIRVNRDVLIPRQETEILADKIIKELPKTPVEIWDICTGSGCLGIAIKKKRPDCRVVLSDISSKALEIAKENAGLNQVETEVVQGDLLAPFQGRKADVVVCNPPYIFENDYHTLDREVRLWEPKIALVGGLKCYQQLAETLPNHLHPGSKVYLEIGAGMGDQVKNLFNGWKKKEVFQDWSSHDRFVYLELE